MGWQPAVQLWESRFPSLVLGMFHIIADITGPNILGV